MKLANNLNRNIFREYDIRGVFCEDLTEDVAYTIGRSYGTYIKKFNEQKAVIGHDNRLSSPILTSALIKGITDSGTDVIDIGLVTTPMFYFAKKNIKIPTGIMATASHNPSEYNGFKLSFTEIGNACGEEIKNFYDFTIAQNFDTGQGSITKEDIKELYIQEIASSISLGKRKVKCVIDLGNGTASIIASEVMERLGIDCDVLNEKKHLEVAVEYLDPSVKIKMENLAKFTKDKYDIGIGLDGDADRVGIVDETGKIISADEYMIIMARYLNNNLKKRKILFDVKCSKALIDELNKLGIDAMMYRTGNSYLNMMMQKGDYEFGGEFSGHLFFRDKWLGFDDGLYASLRMIEILSNTNESLSNLLKGINKYYSTDEIKFAVSEENKFVIVDYIKNVARSNNYDLIELDGARINFDHFWILVRASNTGPNLTMRIEADSEDILDKVKEKAIEDLNLLIDNFK